MKPRPVGIACSVLIAFTLCAASATPAAGSQAGAVAGGHARPAIAFAAQPVVHEWGDMDYGQTSVPVGLTNVTQIAAGESFAVALKGDGTLVGWGNDLYGQLDFTNPPGVGLTYQAVAAGQEFTVALVSDGTLRAFGGSTSYTTVPTAGVGKHFTAIAADGTHALALKNDGTVVAWGFDTGGDTTVPGGLTNVAAIACSNVDSFALKGDGSVLAWGSGDYGLTTIPTPPVGQHYAHIWAGWENAMALLTDGSFAIWGASESGASTPSGLADALSASASDEFAVAVKSDKTVVAWGASYLGEADVPAGLTNVTQVAAGWHFVLALKGDGTVVAWGEVHTPGPIGGIKAIAAGYQHSLGVTASGGVVGWGLDMNGDTHAPLGLTNVVAVAAGYASSYAVKSDGTIVAWGSAGSGSEAPPAGLTGVVAVSACEDTAMALKSDGTVVAWGDNSYGQRTVPPGLSGVVGIYMASDHGLAVKADGTVAAWGDDSSNQVSGAAGQTGIVAVAGGWGFSLGLKSDGTVVEWGLTNPYLQPPAGLKHVVAISATYSDAIALKDDGTVVAFGGGNMGELVVPAGLSHVTTIAGGGYHVDALSNVYSGATYHAIAPARVLDTRPTSGSIVNMGLQGVFKAARARTFKVANTQYVGGGSAVAVPANATAVTGNLTVTGQTKTGTISLGPTLTSVVETTTLNFVVGENRANNVTIGLGPDGTLTAVLRAADSTTTADLIFDVTGYFVPSDATGDTYHQPPTPGRVLDTRSGTGHIGLSGKFYQNKVRTISVAGVKGLGWSSALVPANATAITANVTLTNASTLGFVTLAPTITTVPPKTSTVNTLAGKNTANGVTVQLKSGKVQAVWKGAASGSNVDVILDITGWFTHDLTGMSFHPLNPYRALDSSRSWGLTGPFASGTKKTLTVCLLSTNTPPFSAVGIAGNLTLVNPTANGWAQIAPTISGTPTSSTVNSVPGKTVANGFDVSMSSGKADLIYVGAGGTAQLQLDVNGYWQ